MDQVLDKIAHMIMLESNLYHCGFLGVLYMFYIYFKHNLLTFRNLLTISMIYLDLDTQEFVEKF